jgi:predicted phosphohydrolase
LICDLDLSKGTVIYMALYAIGDLHLSFGTDKPMDVFGGGWVDYTDKLLAGFSTLNADDVCVLCGDTSWGMSLEESLEDFQFIDNLPGRKIILKGNHDYWWSTVAKMESFFSANNITSIEILHNNCYYYEDVAICGTRGWLGDEEFTAEHNAKIYARETNRLKASLQSAKDVDKRICFSHYPVRFKNIICHDMIEVMNEFNVKNCYYGHLHGEGHRLAVRGSVDGINYEIISADFLNFNPMRVG